MNNTVWYLQQYGLYHLYPCTPGLHLKREWSRYNVELQYSFRRCTVLNTLPNTLHNLLGVGGLAHPLKQTLEQTLEQALEPGREPVRKDKFHSRPSCCFHL